MKTSTNPQRGFSIPSYVQAVESVAQTFNKPKALFVIIFCSTVENIVSNTTITSFDPEQRSRILNKALARTGNNYQLLSFSTQQTA